MSDQVQKLSKFDEFDMTGAQEYVKNVPSGLARIPEDVIFPNLESKEAKAKEGDYLSIGPKGESYPISEEFRDNNYIPAKIETEKFIEGLQNKLSSDTLNVMKKLNLSMKDVQPYVKITPVKGVELTQDVELTTDWGVQKGEKGKAFLMFYGSKKETVDGKLVTTYDRAVCQKDEETGLPIGYIKSPKKVVNKGPEFGL